MAKPYTSAHSRTASSRDWATRGLFILLFLASLMLVAFGRSDQQAARNSVSNFFAPIGSFISSPVDTTAMMINNAEQFFMNAGNAGQIAEQNTVLKQWKLQAEQLAAENAQLKALLNVVAPAATKDLTTRVLGSVAGPYRHNYHIAAGTDHGVDTKMAVINEKGLVGRVVQTNASTSSFMAVTDINSRIAVIAGKSRDHAVVKGLGENQMALHYLPEDTQLVVGEKLFTSGDGGLMPAGILVGTVAEVTETQIVVSPAYDRSRLDYVRLLLTQQTQ